MIVSTSVNGFEMKTAVLSEGEHAFVILPGLSPRSVLPSATAVEGMYAKKLKNARIYLVDRREEIPEGYSMRDMAEDTAEVLTELGIRNAAVYGASQGGMIAEILAAGHPELVSALVLASSTSRMNGSLRTTLDRWIALARAGAGDTLASDMVETIFSKEIAARFGNILTMGMRDLSEAELARFIRLSEACAGFDAGPELEKLACPVLVLGAEGDRVMTAEASRELAERSNAELFLYGPEYGHAVYDEAADFASRVAAFVNCAFGEEG